MRLDPTLIAAIIALLVSIVTLWSNPHRSMNRSFFGSSLLVTAWLLALRLAFAGENGEIWLRVASALGAAIVPQLWLMMDLVVNPLASFGQRLKRQFPVLLLMGALIGLCFSTAFIPPESTADKPIYGWGYYAYIAVLGIGYISVAGLAVRAMRRQVGIQRVELQLLLLGGGAAGVAALSIITISSIMRSAELIRTLPLTVIAFYSGTAWVMTTTKLFDARQILRALGRQLAVVLVVAALGWWMFQGLVFVVPASVAAVLCVAVALPLSDFFAGRLKRLFNLNISVDRNARRAAFEASRKAVRVDLLGDSFAEVLRASCQTDRAAVLFGDQGKVEGGGIEISKDSILFNELVELQWVTPERLSRERTSRSREQVAEFLKKQRFDGIVFSGSGSLSVVVAVGRRATRRPYTYPEIQQLIELASIFENALARTHFSVRAQHAEQLATVGLLGASIAHEIRNPLVSIKAFAQLLPNHYSDPAFREKFSRLIGTEVDRIDRLTIQLLDMASPQNYQAVAFSLNPVLQASLELVEGKAQEQGVRVMSELEAEPDKIYSDSGAVKQVALNLCFNALQAAESKGGNRWIRVTTRRVENKIEMIVSDSGPGISDEARSSLFQPFHSTKSTGFGLGLAICRDILTNVNATIAVDPMRPDEGATFRVIFPCLPPLS